MIGKRGDIWAPFNINGGNNKSILRIVYCAGAESDEMNLSTRRADSNSRLETKKLTRGNSPGQLASYFDYFLAFGL
jgi:hypothetical protein